MALPLRRTGLRRKWTGGVRRQASASSESANEQIDLWTLTVSQGFSENFPVTQEILDVMKMFALGANVECYLARVDGAVAGGATLAIREGVAGLFGASTLPAFRNRGVQTALLKERLRRAVTENCDLAVCIAQPGSSSQSNVVRQGFSVLYTRVKFERAWSLTQTLR